jgi:hypothetical protein
VTRGSASQQTLASRLVGGSQPVRVSSAVRPQRPNPVVPVVVMVIFVTPSGVDAPRTGGFRGA